MIANTLDLFFGLGGSTNALINGKADTTRNSNVELFEGDTQNVRVYLRKIEESGTSSGQLGQNETIVLAVSKRTDLSNENVQLLAYSSVFEEQIDEDGDVFYEGVLELNTEQILSALVGTLSLNCILELVVIDSLTSRQFTLQGRLDVNRSAVPPSGVSDLSTPAVNIGSYSTVQEICEGIVDQRIISLKDGTPTEFDTLYELAIGVMKADGLRTEIGTFWDYLEGKALADAGLTVTQLGSIANNEATFLVSVKPYAPSAVISILI